MEFTYQGLVRHGFGFYNPNHAAAAITIILPFIWYLRRIDIKSHITRTAVFFSSILLEALLYTGLALTFSRSGFLALLSAVILWWHLTRSARSHHSITTKLQPLRRAFCLILIIALLVCTGAGSRLVSRNPASVSSVTNRFSLWHAGAQLLAQVPYGTGSGQSGKIISLFYSDTISHPTRTLVNSFMTFTVEQGVWPGLLLCIVIAFSFIALFKAWIISRKESDVSRQYICSVILVSLLAGFISGMTSTCFDYNMLLHKPGAFYNVTNDILQAALCILFMVIVLTGIIYAIKTVQHIKSTSESVTSKSSTGKTFLGACITASLIILVIYGIGVIASHSNSRSSISIINDNDGNVWVRVKRNESGQLSHGTDNLWLGIPDENTNLQVVNNKLSEFAADANYQIPLEPIKSASRILKNIDESVIPVLFGKSCRSAISAHCHNVILFDPAHQLSQKEMKNVKTVYLPRWDERGHNSLWQRYQKRHEFKIILFSYN